MLRLTVIIVLLTALLSSSFAQQKRKAKKDERKEGLMSVKEQWFEGSLLTTDQEELSGLIWFNDNNGVLSFRDGTNARVFTARSIAGFEFFDENLQKQRVFYSIDYDDPGQHGAIRKFFFEVLKDFKTFAVLAKTDPVEVETRSTASNGLYTYSSDTYTQLSQTETIYFLDSKGVVQPYLKVIRKESVGRLFYDTSNEKNKLVNEELFANYITKPVYEKLMAYAKANDLKFSHKEDFLLILNHYAETYAAK